MKNLLKIFVRYLIIVLIAIPNLFIFYFIFTPATIYPVFGLFKIFFKEVLLIGNTFQISNEFFIEIIPACIAGSAYYLLFSNNLIFLKLYHIPKFSKFALQTSPLL